MQHRYTSYIQHGLTPPLRLLNRWTRWIRPVIRRVSSSDYDTFLVPLHSSSDMSRGIPQCQTAAAACGHIGVRTVQQQVIVN